MYESRGCGNSQGTLERLKRLGMVAIPPAAGLAALARIIGAERQQSQVQDRRAYRHTDKHFILHP